MPDVRRRELIALLGGAGAWPLAARGQEPFKPVIGFLNIASPETWEAYVAGFKQGLAQVGFVEGVNVAIEYRWARGQYDRLSALAADLADRKVAVIAANGSSRSVLAAKSATSTIPIVFTFGDGDPVQHGLVESMNRPGGNITGISMFAGALEPKRLELLHEIVPNATVIHMLVNPNTAGAVQDIPDVAVAARGIGLRLQVIPAGTQADIDAAFLKFVREKAQALIVMADGFLTLQRQQITALAARHTLPAVYAWREYVVDGGLASYGSSIRDAYRQSGIYVGQILKGAKTGELPIQQPTKFELVVNLKTAKALGLDLPTSLLLRADEVIE
jgi:putative tryptophan/tyrosine transport system substrate-binding protein